RDAPRGVRIKKGARRAHGRGEAGGARGPRRPPGAGSDRPRAHRRRGAERGAPLHQPALRSQAGGDSAGPGGLMAAPAQERPTVPLSAPKGEGPARVSRKVKREQGRWVREVKGILALALSGFGFVALYAYDPTLHLFDQTSPVGPVGVWLGWAFFWAFGYAGYLFPLLLAGYGASAFIRSRMVTGWPAVARLGLLLLSVPGILTRLSDTLAVQRIHKGGVVGWAVSEALRASMGSVGTWIILLAIVLVARLVLTRVSLHVMSQAIGPRPGSFRHQKP